MLKDIEMMKGDIGNLKKDSGEIKKDVLVVKKDLSDLIAKNDQRQKDEERWKQNMEERVGRIEKLVFLFVADIPKRTKRSKSC